MLLFQTGCCECRMYYSSNKFDVDSFNHNSDYCAMMAKLNKSNNLVKILVHSFKFSFFQFKAITFFKLI